MCIWKRYRCRVCGEVVKGCGLCGEGWEGVCMWEQGGCRRVWVPLPHISHSASHDAQLPLSAQQRGQGGPLGHS